MTGGTPADNRGSASVLRFDVFELDLRSGELRKTGRRIRLQEQPFQILRMLLESPGEVVSRDYIREHLWPEGTVVDFDHSINAAMKRLRDALCDSAEKPRYIETLARRGYRFIGDVEAVRRGVPTEAAMVVPGQAEPVATARPQFRRRILAAIAFAGVILTIAVGATYYGSRIPSNPLQPLLRLDMDLGAEAQAADERGPSVILSPDAARLVYISQSRLFVRRLDQGIATGLAGTERAHSPFFSPDGQWVAFFAMNRLKKVALQSCQVMDLCGAALNDGGSWGEDGNIIAASDVSLSRIPANGGNPARLTGSRARRDRASLASSPARRQGSSLHRLQLHDRIG